MTEEIKQGMTRREVLKKGALFGGTLMWVAPVVQAVGMSPAAAQVASPGGMRCVDVYYDAAPTPIASGSGVKDFKVCVQNCGTDFAGKTNAKAWVYQGTVLPDPSILGTPTWEDASLPDVPPGGTVCGSYQWTASPGTYIHHAVGTVEYAGGQILTDQDVRTIVVT